MQSLTNVKNEEGNIGGKNGGLHYLGLKEDCSERKKIKMDEFLLPEDGYRWHKYGQKRVIECNAIRCYYKCRYASTGCPAKKIVDIAEVAPRDVCISYVKAHNHLINNCRSIRLKYQPGFKRMPNSVSTFLTYPVISKPRNQTTDSSGSSCPGLSRSNVCSSTINSMGVNQSELSISIYQVKDETDEAANLLENSCLPKITQIGSSADEGCDHYKENILENNPCSIIIHEKKYEEKPKNNEGPSYEKVSSSTFVDILDEYPHFYFSSCDLPGPKGNICAAAFPHRKLQGFDPEEPLRFLGGMDTVQIRDLLDYD